MMNNLFVEQTVSRSRVQQLKRIVEYTGHEN
jgi:hypothetical protein